MSNTNLRSGSVRFIALEGDRPVGIHSGSPGEHFQNVRLDEPIQNWQVTDVGDHVYRFAIGGFPFTGVVDDDDVSASDRPGDARDWHVTRFKAEHAYTIELAGDHSLGWTVSPERSPNPHIVIQKIEPGSRRQFFRFEMIDE